MFQSWSQYGRCYSAMRAATCSLELMDHKEQWYPVTIAEALQRVGSTNHDVSFSIQAHFLIDTSAKLVTSRSKPSAFPSVLRSKHSAVQTLNADELNTEAVIQKECPRCKRQEMFYHTKQLRSADEGSTVFYRCECGYQ